MAEGVGWEDGRRERTVVHIAGTHLHWLVFLPDLSSILCGIGYGI